MTQFVVSHKNMMLNDYQDHNDQRAANRKFLADNVASPAMKYAGWVVDAIDNHILTSEQVMVIEYINKLLFTDECLGGIEVFECGDFNVFGRRGSVVFGAWTYRLSDQLQCPDCHKTMGFCECEGWDQSGNPNLPMYLRMGWYDRIDLYIGGHGRRIEFEGNHNYTVTVL